MTSVDMQFGTTQCRQVYFDNHVGRILTDWYRTTFDSDPSDALEYDRLHSSGGRHLEPKISIGDQHRHRCHELETTVV